MSVSHIVIGTAGHVDHGKTSLIRALTGIDTDRLAEEKSRGLSIDLGFAYFDLPGGRRAGIIDVPGHERFIHNMLAGATSTDLVLLVVAGDEGVMPQTRDHVEILDLLGVRGGIVAISKADLVGEEERQIVRMEIEDLLRGTCLEAAPVLAVSTVTGEGIDELRETMGLVGESAKGSPKEAPFRLPIDRVFTMPGFGTVVTGTTVAGRVETHQQVHVLPRDLALRVRSIQVHEEEVETAMEGQRTALNLAGAGKDELSRGDTVCDLEITRPSSLLDARLRLARRLAKDLPGNVRVKLHIGTDEMMARLVPLEGKPLAPASSQFVQLRLQRSTVGARGDHFVIRDASGKKTLGGGSIVDAYAPRRGRRGGEHAKALESLWHASEAELLVRLVEVEGAIPAGDVALRLNTTRAHLDGLLSGPEIQDRVMSIGRGQDAICLSAEAFRSGKAHILKQLEELHAQSPAEVGFPPSLVERGWGLRLGSRVFRYCLEELIREGDVVPERAAIKLPDRGVRLSAEQQQARVTLERLFEEGGVTPPRPEDALRQASGSAGTQAAEQALQAMVKMGELVSVGSGGLLFHRDALQRAIDTVTDYLRKHHRITVAEARDLLGSSRKYLVPMLEHMDKAGHTIRQGDVRVLGRGA
jgi:selenocysteine-specific elongation factor